MRYIPVTGVLHDDGGRTRMRRSPESRRAVGTEVRRHTGTGRAAPQGIAAGIKTEGIRTAENKVDRRR